MSRATMMTTTMGVVWWVGWLVGCWCGLTHSSICYLHLFVRMYCMGWHMQVMGLFFFVL